MCTTGLVTYKSNKSNQSSWTNQTSEDDVDMSDLDENLTESEMMMTEEGEGDKMERIAFPASEYYSFGKNGKRYGERVDLSVRMRMKNVL